MGRSPSCSTEICRKGPWSPEEDALLIKCIEDNGLANYCWGSLPRQAGLMRSGKSCRLRWINYLRPDVKRGSISPEEEDLILRLHRLIGNRWSLIAGRLPGRTDNEIKNYWKCHLRKKVENGSMIDLKSKKSRKKWPQDDPALHAVSFTVPPNSTKDLSRREWVPYYCPKLGKPKTKDDYIPKHLRANSCSKYFCEHFEQTTDQNAGLDDRNRLDNLVVPQYLTGDTDSDFKLVCPNSIFPSFVMDGDIDMEHCFQLLEAAVILSPSASEELATVTYNSNSETSSSGRSTDGTCCCFNMEPSNQTTGKTSYPAIPSLSASETFSLIEQNEEQHRNFETEILAHTQAPETMVPPYGRGNCNISEDHGPAKQLSNRDTVFLTQYCTDVGLDLSGSSSDMQKAFDIVYTIEDWQTAWVGNSRLSSVMNSNQSANCMDVQEDFLYFKNVCPDIFAYCF